MSRFAIATPDLSVTALVTAEVGHNNTISTTARREKGIGGVSDGDRTFQLSPEDPVDSAGWSCGALSASRVQPHRSHGRGGLGPQLSKQRGGVPHCPRSMLHQGVLARLSASVSLTTRHQSVSRNQPLTFFYGWHRGAVGLDERVALPMW